MLYLDNLIISCVWYLYIMNFINGIFPLSTEGANNSYCITSDKKGQHSNCHPILDTIVQWWKRMDGIKKIWCKKSHLPITNGKVLKFLSRLKVKSYPCRNVSYRPHFLYSGRVNNGCIMGKGKLRILSNKEWRFLPELEKYKIQQNNICLDFENIIGGSVVDIVGTFKNCMPHGLAKITYVNNFTSISQFKNGYIHGLQRVWDGSGNLINVGNYNNGLKTGFHWNLEFDHLIYQDMTVVRDYNPLTLVFVFSKNGVLTSPIAGNYYPHLLCLENVHKVDIIQKISDNSDCVTNIDYKIMEKQNYRYMIRSKMKLSLSIYREKPLCKINNDYKMMSTSKRLEHWFKSVDELLDENYEYNHGHQVLWYLMPDLDQIDKNKSLKLISDIHLDPVTNTTTARILGSGPIRIKWDHMVVDTHNRLNGYCDLYVIKEDKKLVPRDNTLQWAPQRFRGVFTHGSLNGVARIHTNTASYAWMTVKDGILHGPCIIYGRQPVFPENVDLVYHYQNTRGKWKKLEKVQKGTRYLGYYKNGCAHGKFWVGMMGGSYSYAHLHGTISLSDGTISGNNISYIYPDMETAFLGKFEDRYMKDGREAKVFEVDCDEAGLLYISKYAYPEYSSSHFYYEPATNISFGGGPPEVGDPYERKLLEVKMSKYPNAGEGVFLKRAVKSGTLISIYSGFLYDQEQGIAYKENCAYNITKSDAERRNCLKYAMLLPSKNSTMNIPPENDKPGRLLPSLGPKVNHHFTLHNSKFQEIEHPRWGLTQGVVTTKQLNAGQELYAYYGYTKSAFPLDAPWYWELNRISDKEERLKTKI